MLNNIHKKNEEKRPILAFSTFPIGQWHLITHDNQTWQSALLEAEAPKLGKQPSETLLNLKYNKNGHKMLRVAVILRNITFTCDRAAHVVVTARRYGHIATIWSSSQNDEACNTYSSAGLVKSYHVFQSITGSCPIFLRCIAVTSTQRYILSSFLFDWAPLVFHIPPSIPSQLQNHSMNLTDRNSDLIHLAGVAYASLTMSVFFATAFCVCRVDSQAATVHNQSPLLCCRFVFEPASLQPNTY